MLQLLLSICLIRAREGCDNTATDPQQHVKGHHLDTV